MTQRIGITFEAFNNLYGSRVVRHCRSKFSSFYMKDSGAWEDALSEVWYDIWRSLPRYRGESELFTWAHVIIDRTFFRCIERWEKRRKRELPVDPEPTEPEYDENTARPIVGAAFGEGTITVDPSTCGVCGGDERPVQSSGQTGGSDSAKVEDGMNNPSDDPEPPAAVPPVENLLHALIEHFLEGCAEKLAKGKRTLGNPELVKKVFLEVTIEQDKGTDIASRHRILSSQVTSIKKGITDCLSQRAIAAGMSPDPSI